MQKQLKDNGLKGKTGSASFGCSPRWGKVHQGFEMVQSQPSLQCHCSPLFLKTSQAQTLVDYPKSTEIYGDCTPEC